VTVARTLSWDWYPGVVPDNVDVHDDAYVETTFSFLLYRSKMPVGVRYERGASTYLGTMFDVGPQGSVHLGEYALVHGARIVCDDAVIIGSHALISWNVVFMDTYRLPPDAATRRDVLRRLVADNCRFLPSAAPARPVVLESNVWVGFDAIVLPGVRIGEGSIVGARSVVREDVEPYTIVAGNPARTVRKIDPEEGRGAAARF
jgi:acetyltransferase-like isoleucine patch superfamily enzyme